MKRFAYLIMAIFCLGAMITTASAQNAAGDWDVVLNTPGGARNFKAVFKVDGDKLTGELKREGSSEPGGLPIQGKVNGSEIQLDRKSVV